jgi:hypothetical protein
MYTYLMKKTIIGLIIIIVLAAVGYVVFSQVKTEKKNVFQDADNFYSVEYPVTWQSFKSVNGQDMDAFTSADKNTVIQVIKIDSQIAQVALGLAKKDSTQTINGYTVDKYTQSDTTTNKKGIYWVVNVPVGSVTVDLIFLVITSTAEDGSSIVKTLKINSQSIPVVLEMVNKAETAAQNNGKGARIKASISNIRAQAEIFFDKPQSYLGVCKDAQVSALLSGSGSTDVACKDAKKAYAVSAKLFNADYFCADSTGAALVTKSPVATTICPK